MPLNIFDIINSGHSCLNRQLEYNLNVKRICATNAKLDWGASRREFNRTGESTKHTFIHFAFAFILNVWSHIV